MNMLQSLCVATASLALGLALTPPGVLPEGLGVERVAAAIEHNATLVEARLMLEPPELHAIPEPPEPPESAIYVFTSDKPAEEHALLLKHPAHAPEATVAETVSWNHTAADALRVAEETRCVAQRLRARL